MNFTHQRDWQIALRQQIEEIARRNSDHKKYAEVQDRTQEMDDLVVKLRELVNTNPEEAARLHVQAVSILDETDRLIESKLPDASSCPQFTPFPMKESILRHTIRNKVVPEKTTTTMRFTTFADVEETELVELKADGVVDERKENNHKKSFGEKISNLFASENSNENGDETKRDAKKQSNKWNLFCTNKEKETHSKTGNDVRDLWKTQFEFFLSIVGFTVGVGNTIKFPSLAYQYGGGVFLIPYFVCLVLFGLPIVFMHLCIGQYSGLSASGAFWKMMPIASGIGWTLVVLALPVSIYYNIIVAWSVYYFWFSLKGFFTGVLPWNRCAAHWPKHIPCCLLGESPECFLNAHSISSPEAYFHYEVLNRTAQMYLDDDADRMTLISNNNNISYQSTALPLLALNTTLSYQQNDVDGLNDILNAALGPIQSHLALSLAIAWILVFFGVFKGIGSIGWAVTITATLPYLLLGMLLLRGVSLPGAQQGLAFLFKPKVEKLWSIPMWKSAAEQVFYSLGIDAGPLISMASFSRYRNNIYRDAVAVVIINTFTSVLAGMVIFSFIGFVAHIQNQPFDDILQHDSLYIAFTIYPGVTSFMDMMGGPLWAALFFAMLTLSALDAEFAWIEMIISSVLKKFDKANRHTEIRLVVGLCFFCFICGLPLTTRGGIFIFHSIENLNANWNSFSLSLLLVVIVCYIYGVDNFIEDIGEMLRVPTSLEAELRSNNLSIAQISFWVKAKFFFGPTGTYIRWTWSFFSPCVLGFLLVSSVFTYQRVTFEGKILPIYYELVAWITMTGPLFVVPLTALYILFDAYRNGKPLSSVFDSSQWRHKKSGEDTTEPKHTEKEDNDYWSIVDPVSRVASARRPNATMADDVGYNTMVEIINEWAKKNNFTSGSDDDAENQFQLSSNDNDDSVSKQTRLKNKHADAASTSSSVPFNDSKSPIELSLFGAPPSSDVIIEKTNTVIHKVPKRSDNQRRNRIHEVETPYNVAKFNLTFEAKARLERGREAYKERTKTLHRSTSLDDANNLEKNSNKDSESATPNRRSSQTMSGESSSYGYSRSLQDDYRNSNDHQSLGSISITPIDHATTRNRSNSSVSNPDLSILNRRRLLTIKRPKPIDIPPPFKQL